jgi:hypothetical protein
LYVAAFAIMILGCALLNALLLYKRKEKEDIDRFHKYFNWHTFDLKSVVEDTNEEETDEENLQLEFMYSSWGAESGILIFNLLNT